MQKSWSNKSILRAGFAGLVFMNLVHSDRAAALELTAPINLETAQVLPVGVRNPRFLNVFMSVDSKFNGGGTSEPLGRPIYRTVKWSDVMGVQHDRVDRVMIQSALNDSRLDMNGSPGSTTGQVNTSFNVKVPVLAMGVSDRLTVGVAMPIVNASVSADTGFNVSQDGQTFMNRLCALSIEQCNSAARRMNNSVNEKLSAYGYNPIESKNVSGIGDIQLVGKYNVYKAPEGLLSVKTAMVLPTGVQANPDAPIDIPTGDGRFQLGATLVYDRSLPMDFKWNTFGGWQALLPNQMVKRIPTGQDDPVSRDKEQLTRNFGNQFAFGTSVTHHIPSIGFVAGAGYNFQFLSKSRYSGGTQFSAERYSYLEDLTPSQVLHSTTLMAGFSTVEWYQNKKFVYPFQANIIFSHPIVGRNVTTNNVLTGELVLFF